MRPIGQILKRPDHYYMISADVYKIGGEELFPALNRIDHYIRESEEALGLPRLHNVCKPGAGEYVKIRFDAMQDSMYFHPYLFFFRMH